tara:strand:+ start:135 stop:503 length:369 start_codon:yes stop_codon:yes gene_type:complete
MLRVQSLYLLISSAINFTLLVMTIYSDFKDNLLSYSYALFTFAAFLYLFLIFLYNKKNLQFKILRFSGFAYFIFGLYIAFAINHNYPSFLIFGIVSSCILSSLAIKNIKKDIDLLNSINRIR